jgi:hypothetical protein
MKNAKTNHNHCSANATAHFHMTCRYRLCCSEESAIFNDMSNPCGLLLINKAYEFPLYGKCTVRTTDRQNLLNIVT